MNRVCTMVLRSDSADAILIRAISAETGVEMMLERRKMNGLKYNVTAGPGCLTKALGIDRSMDLTSLSGPVIWVCDRSISNILQNLTIFNLQHNISVCFATIRY